MRVAITCPGCDCPLSLPAAYLGRRIRCPGCSIIFDAASAPRGCRIPPARDNQDERKPAGERVTLRPQPPTSDRPVDPAEEVLDVLPNGLGRARHVDGVPPYLYVLALLPLAVPAIAFAFELFGGGAVESSLWGAFGTVLAGIGLAVVRRNAWGVVLRTALTVTGAVVGFFELTACGLTGLLLRHANIAESEWILFEPPGDNCRVLLPGNPQPRQQVLPNGAVMHTDTIERLWSGEAYVFGMVDLFIRGAARRQQPRGIS